MAPSFPLPWKSGPDSSPLSTIIRTCLSCQEPQGVELNSSKGVWDTSSPLCPSCTAAVEAIATEHVAVPERELHNLNLASPPASTDEGTPPTVYHPRFWCVACHHPLEPTSVALGEVNSRCCASCQRAMLTFGQESWEEVHPRVAETPGRPSAGTVPMETSSALSLPDDGYLAEDSGLDTADDDDDDMDVISVAAWGIPPTTITPPDDPPPEEEQNEELLRVQVIVQGHDDDDESVVEMQVLSPNAVLQQRLADAERSGQVVIL